MKIPFFSVIAGVALCCALVFPACTLDPSVTSPAEAALPQPAGMPAGIGITQAAPPYIEGNHIVYPVAVSGALNPIDPPAFTPKSGFKLAENAWETDCTPQSVEAIIANFNDLFGDLDEDPDSPTYGAYPLKNEEDDPYTVNPFTIVQLDVKAIKSYLKGKLPKDKSPIWWVQENPAAFGGEGKPYPPISNGWKMVGTSVADTFATRADDKVPIEGLTVDNFDRMIDSFAVVLVAGSTVKISFFDALPYPDAVDLSGANADNFKIRSSGVEGSSELEPVFVYTINAEDLTVLELVLEPVSP